MIPFLPILYDEDMNPDETYRGVELRMGSGAQRDGPPEVFNTGNPTVDYHTAMLVVWRRWIEAGGDKDEDPPVMGSSSIDHFVMDGGTLRDENPSGEDVQAAITITKAYLSEE